MPHFGGKLVVTGDRNNFIGLAIRALLAHDGAQDIAGQLGRFGEQFFSFPSGWTA